MASLVATSVVADRKLFASFIACASPGRSPTRWRRSLRPASTGATCAHASSAAAYITASVRARPRHAARHRRVDVGHSVFGQQVGDGLRARTPMVEVSTTCVVQRPDAATDLTGDLLRRGTVGQAEHDDAARCVTSTTDGTTRRARGRALWPDASCATTVWPVSTRFAASTLPMLPRPTKPTGFRRQPASRAARAASIPRRAADAAGRAAVRGDLEQQLVELVVGDAGLGDAARVEHELLHPAQRRGHGHHEQAAVVGGEADLQRPHAPCHRRDVVLELGGHRVGVGRDPVDVRIAEHGPAHRPRRAKTLRLFHRAARQYAGSTIWSILAAPLSGTAG